MDTTLIERQGALNLEGDSSVAGQEPKFSRASALEDDDFPFEAISDIAEQESWRKEINRPVYHIHKWWAQRLGSVFRATLIGALSPSGTNVLEAFYRPTEFPEKVVFDPFMGSGTTVGEAAKLGANVIGRDINPVAYFLVKNALAQHDRASIFNEFKQIELDVADKIRSLYCAELSSGQKVDVLYYFWVKTVSCPNCQKKIDLNSSRIFARHAYVKRYPQARATCPKCGDVNTVQYNDEITSCKSCACRYNPQVGAARGQKATCPDCECSFPIAKTVREKSNPPEHRLYAKLVLHSDGSKEYLPATNEDHALYDSASRLLAERKNPYPVVAIEAGYNTNQAIAYNYRHWHEMFNDRQLLCLSILSERIRKIQDSATRDLFTCLFSGSLEFNNMFASYKGEGTGAVRHMFSHHILKPERVPLEANLWGTPKSSGSFSTMFEGRIRRALDYAANPFEQKISRENGKKKSEKIYGLSKALGFDLADSYSDFEGGKTVYLSCGDSSRTDIASKSVDAVVTDPPFFDNVHYSQLADFFHVWQKHIIGSSGNRKSSTTRSKLEVQNADVEVFTDRLGAVLQESQRVLKDDGLLAFTYHHSRSDGWSSVLRALMKAGFVITAAQPIKAEMSLATPKHQAKEPIDIDIVLVCRKKAVGPAVESGIGIWQAVRSVSCNQVARMAASGRRLSRNDVRVIVMAQFLRRLSTKFSLTQSANFLAENNVDIEEEISFVNEYYIQMVEE